jgi:hypothetical protein
MQKEVQASEAATEAKQEAAKPPAAGGKEESSLDKKKRLLAQMEKSGNKAGAASLRASIEKDESLQRLGEQPAKPAPAKQEPKPAVQAVKPASNQPYSESDLEAAKRNLAMAEKSGGKAAISAARSRVEKMESANKVADASVKPISTAPNGAAINKESQKVAGAQGATKGAGSSQNVVAPVTTTNVNQNQTQNVSMKPSATPTFGSWQSHFYNAGLSGQRPVF